ncbi:MAG: ATP-binding cassette domain-containing protein [Armatimonadetes bacterium]|nr:ATP-binding cassette domain-containing protein [Armatimonadota bacterium]
MLLGVHGVSKSFGVDIILEDVSFRIDARQKVALVGRNGTGKTTLLRIITGEYEPDTGSVQLARGARIGYLRQEDAISGDRTVLQEAQASQSNELELKARLEELEKWIEQGATQEDLEEYALVHEHFLEAEGYSLEHDARTVLARMGFTEDEFEKPTSVLSGGEKTRLAIARLLLEEPDLLILDEPTNHLDLEATEWLEGWINAYHGAVLLVSHDRVFLENTATSFLDLRERTVKAYSGRFDQYMKVKAEDDARRASLAAKQEAEIAKLDEYVRRFMNSQRTAQARGRQKQMFKLIEDKVDRRENEKGMAAGFGKAVRSGDQVIECKWLSVGYGQPLFPPLDWTVRWGERWGVIGENGAGKSTLLKTILGEVPALGGDYKIGSNVVCGLFRQDVTDLDPEATPLSVMTYDEGMDTGPARDLLGRFLFSGDDVLRPIKTLSGGEKNKLELARLTQASPNLLVLDEPTNHLDMDSREALAQVLREYKGTLVLISHDRWLLGQVTENLLDVRRSGAVIFPGGYTDYRNRAAAKPPQPAKQLPASAPEPTGISQRELSKEIQRLEKLVAQLEEEVATAEREQRDIERQLANLPPTADVLELTRSHSRVVEEVAASMSAWEAQTLKLEELKTKQGPAGHEPGVTFRAK